MAYYGQKTNVKIYKTFLFLGDFIKVSPSLSLAQVPGYISKINSVRQQSKRAYLPLRHGNRLTAQTRKVSLITISVSSRVVTAQSKSYQNNDYHNS